MKEQPKLKRIGFVSRLHSYRGELSCVIENGDVGDYENEKFLFLEIDGFHVPFLVQSYRDKNGMAIVKFEDVDDEEKAKRFVKKEIYAEDSGEKETEEITWEDLQGFEAIDEAHGSLGKIEKVEEYPQQFIATCRVNGKEVLIPLSDEIISGIDDEKKIVYLDLPEGLLNIYME